METGTASRCHYLYVNNYDTSVRTTTRNLETRFSVTVTQGVSIFPNVSAPNTLPLCALPNTSAERCGAESRNTNMGMGA